MTRHSAYAPRARHPFASFPHAEAARRWIANHPDTPVRFVPPLPDADDVARAFADDAVRAVAIWEGTDGSSYVWPSALVDNRRSRVLARIARFDMDVDPATLVVVSREDVV